MTFLVYLALIAAVVIGAAREIRAERRTIAAVESDRPLDPLFAEKRHGCLVVLGTYAFSFWLLLFTFTYDNPWMGKGVPEWIHTAMLVPGLLASLASTVGAPVTLVLGLVGWRTGKVGIGVLRQILAVFVLLYTPLAIAVVVDAWYPRESMGELSNVWKELGLYALLGELLLAGLLISALRASRVAASATGISGSLGPAFVDQEESGTR